MRSERGFGEREVKISAFLTCRRARVVTPVLDYKTRRVTPDQQSF